MNIDRTRKAPRTPRRKARMVGAPIEPTETETPEEKPAPKRRRTRKAAEEAKGDD